MCGGAACATRQARTFEGFSPHILYQRLQLKVHTSHPQKRLQSLPVSALSAAFSLKPEAQKKTDCRGSTYRGQSKKETPQGFAACGRRRGALPPDCPLAGGRLLKKAGENLKRGTAVPFRNLKSNSYSLYKSCPRVWETFSQKVSHVSPLTPPPGRFRQSRP